MLETLITSKTRIKLLLKFFLNGKTNGYLRNLEQEFGESSNAIRLELNKFENAGLLLSHMEGNKKIFQANANHPLYADIHSLVRKYIGIDRIIEQVVHQVGKLKAVYLIGNYARGVDAGKVEFLLIGKPLDEEYLHKLVQKGQKLVKRAISFEVMEEEEWHRNKDLQAEGLLLWSSIA